MAEKDRNIRIRDKEIRVKVSDSELQYAKEKAEYCNLTMSEYIRKMVFDGVVVKYEAMDVSELAKQLNAISQNLHHIALRIDDSMNNESDIRISDLLEEFDKMQEIIYSKVYGV